MRRLLRVNYTWSHSQDEVSNGGFLPFSAGALLSPLPGELLRQFGDADYDIRHNLTASYTYELPVYASRSWLAALLNGWQISETFFWHTGVPFTVQSAPYTANGKGIINGGGPQFVWSDLYVSKQIARSKRPTVRAELQVFNLFNRANSALPTPIAGVPGERSTQTGFGALTYTTSPPTGLVGVGLGGDNSPRMIAVQVIL